MDFLEERVFWGGIKWHNLTCERLDNDLCLEKYGYKVYSQNDEDGIIQEIFNRIGTTNKTFIEFGVQNGLECNSHYLLFKDWKGLWIEGSQESCNEIKTKFYPLISDGTLKVENAFITRDNINTLIHKNDIQGEIDLLSIDVDGNDYYIWEKIEMVKPRVIIIEYNGKFPPDLEWIMAYNENHIWDGSDWHGASLKALELLGTRLNYQLVGTNLNGANAFFVRKDLINNLFFEPATAENLYNPLRLQIIHKSGHPARYCLKKQEEGLGIFNYTEDTVAIPLYGFYDEEKWDNGHTVRWISSKNSCIIFYNKHGEYKEEIKICFWNLIPYEKYTEKLKLDIKINGYKTSSVAIDNEEGELVLKIPDNVRNNKVYKLEFDISYLWKPSIIFGSSDNRELGIAVAFDSIIKK